MRANRRVSKILNVVSSLSLVPTPNGLGHLAESRFNGCRGALQNGPMIAIRVGWVIRLSPLNRLRGFDRLKFCGEANVSGFGMTMPVMCANYTPVTEKERLKFYFAVQHAELFPDETWPGYAAPFIRRPKDQLAPAREVGVGLFGLIPHWSKDLVIGRRTYNARSETVAEKPSFRDAWRYGRRCIVAAENIFEPNWESGKAVRWRIGRKDGAPMGIAGLWGFWKGPDGKELLSFTMLTVNADGHEVMRHFHKPEDEKRMVVMLDAADYDAWLNAPIEETREFLTRYPTEHLQSEPAPRPKKA